MTESDLRDAIVATALAQVGKPYIWGADNPKTGFDCSGLVEYAYKVNGVAIPHNSVAQYNAGTPVDQPQKADPVFFQGSDPPAPGHEAMYVGGGVVVVAPHSGANVQTTTLAYMRQYDRYYGARSFLGPGTANPAPPTGSPGGAGQIAAGAAAGCLLYALPSLLGIDPDRPVCRKRPTCRDYARTHSRARSWLRVLTCNPITTRSG